MRRLAWLVWLIAAPAWAQDVSLSWQAPTQCVDGADGLVLSHYGIYRSESETGPAELLPISPGAAATQQLLVGELSASRPRACYRMTATGTCSAEAPAESAQSNVVCRDWDGQEAPGPVVNLRIEWVAAPPVEPPDSGGPLTQHYISVSDLSDLSGFTQRGSTSGTFDLYDDGGVDTIRRAVAGFNTGAFISWDAVGNGADTEQIEIALLMRATGATDGARVGGPAARGHISGSDFLGVSFQRYSDGSANDGYGHNGVNAATLIGAVNNGSLPSQESWHWMRYRLETDGSATTVRLKAWLMGDSEPESWTQSWTGRTDHYHGQSGYAGFAVRGNTATLYIRAIGVGTNGDSAPLEPVTSGATVDPEAQVQTQHHSAPALTQEHVLDVADMVQAQAFSEPTATVEHVVSPEGQAQAQAHSTPGLTQDHQIDVADQVQAQALGTAALSQTHQLSPLAQAQLQALGLPTLTQTHLLAAGSMVQAQAFGAAGIAQDHQLVPVGVAQTQVHGTAGLTQAHMLAAVDLAQLQVNESASLVITGVLSPRAIAQIQALGAVVLTQDHQLQVVDLAQLQALGEPSATQTLTVDPVDLAQIQDNELVTIVVTGILSPLSIVQQQALSAGAITQEHVLGVEDITQLQVFSAGFRPGFLEVRSIRVIPAIEAEIAVVPALAGTVSVKPH